MCIFLTNSIFSAKCFRNKISDCATTKYQSKSKSHLNCTHITCTYYDILFNFVSLLFSYLHKALLIFHKADNIYEIMQQACNRQHLEVTLVKSMDSAMESLCSQTEYFHIIIIDTRSAKHLDAEHIAR